MFAPSTTFGKDVVPRVAALLGVAQVSDIMKVDDAHTFQRPIYAGNAIVTVQAPAGPDAGRDRAHRVVCRRGRRRRERADRGVESCCRTADAYALRRTRRRARATAPTCRAPRASSPGGRGVGSAENFAVIFKLADKLGAAVGASRAAVDAGYVPSDLQVGQTGKIIAPELYMAIGISGAIQHLTGIKDAGTIVAINKDGEAPIFEIADIGLVGDLFKIIPELEQALA